MNSAHWKTTCQTQPQSPTRPSASLVICVLALSLLMLPADGIPQMSAPGNATLSLRDQTSLHMVQLRHAGETDTARKVVRDYLSSHPTDATMLYNLACLDLSVGEKEQALANLERALANGYTNFRLIDIDRDLKALREDNRFLEMVSRYENDFRDLLHSRALTLPEGYPVAGIRLEPNGGFATGGQALINNLQITYLATELKISLTIEDPHYRDNAPPWRGGSGVLVNLVMILSPDDYESKRYFSFGFGIRDGKAEASLVAKHSKVFLQADSSLTPNILRENDHISYEISIPWKKFTPYAPPLDQEMGLNIFYVGAGQGANRPIMCLMPEDHLAFESYPWRRYVPIYLESSDRSRPALNGRLYQRLVEQDSVDVQLATWSPATGNGECTLSLTSPDGTPVPGICPEARTFTREAELCFFNYSIDVSALPPGSWQLLIQMKTQDGTRFTRAFPFHRVDPDWLNSLNERIFVLSEEEKSILKFHIFALAQKLDRRHPQDDPSPMLAAHEKLTRLVELSETKGSCLPDHGFFLGGFSSSDKTQRFCALYLPPGFRDLADPRLLMVIAPEPGTEEQLARALGSALRSQPDLVILVPQSHGYSSLTTSIAAYHTKLAIEWAQKLLGAGPVALAGLGIGADAALETSLKRPDLCRRVLLDTDNLRLRSDHLMAAGLDSTLQAQVNNLPYTLISTRKAAARRHQLDSMLRNLGFRVMQLDPAEENQAISWITTWLQTSF